MKTIAIVSKSAGLAEAIQAILAPRHIGAEFKTVTKVSEAPADAIIASLGIPTFIPGSKSVSVISMGTRMCKEEADRKVQWDILRNEASTSEMILPELGNPDGYTILPERATTTIKLGLTDHRIAIAEAADDAAKLVAYKAAYEYLMTALPLK